MIDMTMEELAKLQAELKVIPNDDPVYLAHVSPEDYQKLSEGVPKAIADNGMFHNGVHVRSSIAVPSGYMYTQTKSQYEELHGYRDYDSVFSHHFKT